MNKMGFRITGLLCMLSFTTASADHSKKKNENFDYIIVGNGTAGALLARKLSDANDSCQFENKVLVIEAGYNYDHDQFALDPDAVPPTPTSTLLSNPPYAFRFTYSISTSPQTCPGTPPPIPPTSAIASAAKGWGGGSMHNYMIAVRGTPHLYNDWASLSGDNRWSYNNLLPAIRAIESYFPFAATSANPPSPLTHLYLPKDILSPTTSSVGIRDLSTFSSLNLLL